MKIRICFWCEGGKGSKLCRMSAALGESHEQQFAVTILPSTSEEMKKKYNKLRV